VRPTDESPLLLVDRVQSLNYDGPDGAEVFADAGTQIDLVTGALTSPNLVIQSDGTLIIGGSVAAAIVDADDKADAALANAATAQSTADGKIDTGGAANDVNSNITVISGSKIRTGTIESLNWSAPSGTPFAVAGTQIDLDAGDIVSTGIAVDGTTGDVDVKGDVTAETLTLLAADGSTVVATFDLNGSFLALGTYELTLSTFASSSTNRGLYWDGSVVGFAIRDDSVSYGILGPYVEVNGSGTPDGQVLIRMDGLNGTTNTTAQIQVGYGTNNGIYLAATDGIYVADPLTVGITTGNITIGPWSLSTLWSAIEGANGYILLDHASTAAMYVRAKTGNTLYLGGSHTTAITSTGSTLTFAHASTFSSTLAAGATTLSSTLSVAGVASFAAGSAALPSIARTGDLNTGIYFPSADEIAISAGGAYIALFRDDAQTVFRLPPNQDTSSGDATDAILIDSYDTSTAKGRFAGIAFRTRYSTDRAALARVWNAGGDRLGFRNWGNTAWIALDASAFTVSSSARGKTRIRPARDVGGVLDIVVPADRALAYDQMRRVEPVLFDNRHDDDRYHTQRRWPGCVDHDTEADCQEVECVNADPDRRTNQFHVCDLTDWCGGTNESPCYDVSQHFDRVGLIAEALDTVWPKAVAKNVDDGSAIGINYDVVTVELINVVQHLIEHVADLDRRVR